MATRFEAWLVGDDREHLAAVGESLLDEIERIESLLSRFNPASEIYRVNRSAAVQPVLVDYELYAVLQDCVDWFERTEGFFNVAHGARSPDNASIAPGELATWLPFTDAVELLEEQRTVRFNAEHVMLDLGGYGKGYALDSANHILDQYAIRSGVVHGGNKFDPCSGAARG